MTRRRADTLLAERGLAPSRTAAAATVRAGRVRLGKDGSTIEKPSELVPEDAELLVEEGEEFVSRGGIKLNNALDELSVVVEDRLALDVGASTGGFTDCLLQRGARMVIAVDVGYGQLDWSLRQDSRVLVMERLNARYLGDSYLPFRPELITVDVSFISLAMVMPSIVAPRPMSSTCSASSSRSSSSARRRWGRAASSAMPATAATRSAGSPRPRSRRGSSSAGLASSGLPGPKGNRETFVWAARSGEPIDLDAALEEVEP